MIFSNAIPTVFLKDSDVFQRSTIEAITPATAAAIPAAATPTGTERPVKDDKAPASEVDAEKNAS